MKKETSPSVSLQAHEIDALRRQLEWNRAAAANAESRGQFDTCYHTDIKRLEAALKAAGMEINNVNLD